MSLRMREASGKKMFVLTRFAQPAWFPGRPQGRNTPAASLRCGLCIPKRIRGRERRQALRPGRELLPAIGIDSVLIEARAGLRKANECRQICDRQVRWSVVLLGPFTN